MADDMIWRDPYIRKLWRESEAWKRKSPHLGLLFERFPPWIDGEGWRHEWLSEFRKFAEGPIPAGRFDENDRRPTKTSTQRLADIHARLNDLVINRGGETRIFTTKSRLAIGLGNASATEVGFSFDASCGLPVLPGSSVKGLARAGAELDGKSETDGDVVRLLGEGPKGKSSGQGGQAIFLDALPAKWPKFDIDIINRHHDAENLRGQKLPLDADKPNPVHFLTVAKGVQFVFRLLPAPGSKREDLVAAWQWLAKALDNLGAGAKTAVGYGTLAANDRPSETGK